MLAATGATWVSAHSSLASARGSESPFAVEVVSYDPAPGQFVNDPEFNDPSRAVGPPSGRGTSDPDLSSIVSLGGFGGSITLRFDHPVEDHPLNPFGLDAVVFGNAFFVADNASRRWAECATIEIALDENGNGRIDEDLGETWYLIPGSHLPDPALARTTRSWDDDPLSPVPPALLSWIPPGRSGAWQSTAYLLPSANFAPLIIVNPATDPELEGIWGYAEYSPTLVLGDLDGDDFVDDTTMSPDDFYTVPDDPLTRGFSPGSGGGDAFDIAWAVDPLTGNLAQLAAFDCLRLTSAVDAPDDVFGEKSPEIDAASDVAPDPFGDCDGDLDIDLADGACFQRCAHHVAPLTASCALMDRDLDAAVTLNDWLGLIERLEGWR